jgi:NAD-dependent deacetylase
MPEAIWAWYLYRRAVCRSAAPNAAHLALVELEKALENRFALVTQNVDGLHRRAGNSQQRTFEIHGYADMMRCSRDCRASLTPIPDEVSTAWPKERTVGDDERHLLRC